VARLHEIYFKICKYVKEYTLPKQCYRRINVNYRNSISCLDGTYFLLMKMSNSAASVDDERMLDDLHRLFKPLEFSPTDRARDVDNFMMFGQLATEESAFGKIKRL